MERYRRDNRLATNDNATRRIASNKASAHELLAALTPISAEELLELINSNEVNCLSRSAETQSGHRLVDRHSQTHASASPGTTIPAIDFRFKGSDSLVVAWSKSSFSHPPKEYKSIDAARHLRKDRKWAAGRKRLSAEKGRRLKQRSLGTDSAPSGDQPKKRRPRATDRVAAKTGVSRERLTVDRIAGASPKLAAKVAAGNIKKPKPKSEKAKNVSKPKVSVTTPTKSPAGLGSVWRDEFTVVNDTPQGIRIHRCRNATMYVHKTRDFTGVVLPEGDEWCWFAGSAGSDGTLQTREEAEEEVLGWLTARLRDAGPERKPQTTAPRKPR